MIVDEIAELPDDPTAKPPSQWRERGDTADGECISRVKSLDSLVSALQVDMLVWQVDSWEATKWEMGYTTAEKQPGVQDLWRIKAKFQRRKGWNPTEFRQILVDDIKQLAARKSWPTPKRCQPNEVLAWLSIYDHHFGKLAWAPETGSNYDLHIAEQRFNTAADVLLGRSKTYKPERVGIVAGQDALHVDQGRFGMTAKGTPQDVDGRWQKAFRVAKNCYIRAIEQARKIAPVEVLCVPGNHDSEKLFCLGEVLGAYFHGCDDVTVTNTPALWSSFRWGDVLLYVGHFDKLSEKAKGELPNIMAKECGLDFAETKWHEIHAGHIHQEKERTWIDRRSEVVGSTTIRFLPSLSGTDLWHAEHGYRAPLAAECHLYSRVEGRIGYLQYCATGEEECSLT